MNLKRKMIRIRMLKESVLGLRPGQSNRRPSFRTAKHSSKINEHYRRQNRAKKKEQSSRLLAGKQRLDDGCRSNSCVMSRGAELLKAEVEDKTFTTGTDGTGTGSRPGWEC